ncbi:hypothetical protein SAMN05421863_100667 [Nitrosomonas communis]|uniref:Uncharacterized protein n=1 Tax=Nitrosomonas communis TaxID=44574 RepID=A0A1I4LCR7_9PROT|nr:hypothetical protein SAMN05421863_100667 [Nitrosomonas communis]
MTLIPKKVLLKNLLGFSEYIIRAKKIIGRCAFNAHRPSLQDSYYLSVRMNSANFLAFSSLTLALGGIGIVPHTPLLPFLIFPAK